MTNNQVTNTKVDWRILNWLRGLAALYVTIHHVTGQLFSDATIYSSTVNPKSNWSWWEWLNILIFQHATLGQEFVILFFLLSGFSIAHSLRNEDNTKGFYKRRFIRLYPTYLTGIIWALFICLLIKLLTPQVYYNATEGFGPVKEIYDRFVHLPTLIGNLFYLPKFNVFIGQYWSLSYEVVFYILAPFLIRRLRTFGVIVVISYTIGMFLFGITYDDKALGDSVLAQFSTNYSIYFLIGILFYKYRSKITANYSLSKLATLIVLFILFELMLVSKAYVFANMANKVTGMIAVVFTFFLLFGSFKHNFRVKWLEKIGNYSYTLYVTHFASIFIAKIVAYRLGMNFHNINSVSYWYFGVGICLGVAYIFYIFVERPGIKVLERLRDKLQKDKPAKLKSSRPVDVAVPSMKGVSA